MAAAGVSHGRGELWSCKPMTPALVPLLDQSVRIDDAGDRELVHRISCADRDAFQQLYLDYHKRLARFLVRVIRHYEDLEEIINDALLIVWQHAGDFRGASRVSTWIFGIAYRCALKSIRRSKSRSNAMTLEIRDGEAFVKDAAEEAEDRQLLNLALSCLPHEQRLVLILAYYRDFSCEEIAAIIDCPVNTVKSRMYQARRKLRSIISDTAPKIPSIGPAVASRSPGVC
jgi:RNA polymerase sigma-70 factor (ECF subfamily)